jgi:hypothetical protein
VEDSSSSDLCSVLQLIHVLDLARIERCNIDSIGIIVRCHRTAAVDQQSRAKPGLCSDSAISLDPSTRAARR